MTRAELLAEWQRRKAEALETGSTAPVAKLADVILKQLDHLGYDDTRNAAIGGNGTTPDRLLTAADIAERMKVSKRYVYANADRWPFTRRLGRAVRFSAAGLDTWLTRVDR